MGVSAHFFAYDPAACSVPCTIEQLRKCGALDEELEVMRTARGWLAEIASPLGDNKKWNANLAGDWAWSAARKHVETDARGSIDRWLSHLFWDQEHCCCDLEPRVVEDGEVVYDAELIEHIVGLRCNLAPVEKALTHEFAGESPPSERFDVPWIYDFDGFCWLTQAWHTTFENALRAGPGWSLLRWVWV